MKKRKCMLLSFAVVSVSLFTSCEIIGTSLPWYFSEYTNNASVVNVTYDDSYPRDASGVLCLPSGADRTIKFTLRNPQKYLFKFTNVFSGKAAMAEQETLSAAGTEALSMTQSEDDPYTITAVVPDAFLTALDCGTDKDMTFTMTFTEQKAFRNFTYTLPLHADSAPPDVDGAVVYTNGEKNTYIACFYMPAKSQLASTGSHRDINKLTITTTSGYTGETTAAEYPVRIADDGTFTFTDGTVSYDSTLFQPAGTWTMPATWVKNKAEFPERPLAQPVYYLSSDQLSDNNTTYTLVLADDAGLTSSVTTSVKAVPLDKVTVKNADGDTLEDGDKLDQDEGSSYCTVTVYPPETTTYTDPDTNETTTYDTHDAAVVYKVYKISSAGTETLLFSGKSTGGSAKIKLPSGNIRLDTYARKSLFADSTVLQLGCTVLTTRCYVNPEYAETDKSTGSREYPFTSIQDAMNALSVKNNVKNTITLLGSVTAVQHAGHTDTVLYLDPDDGYTDLDGTSASALYFTLKADTASTDEGTAVTLGAAGDSLRALYVAKNVTVTLQDIAVKGWNSAGVSAEVEEGAVLQISGTTSFAYEATEHADENYYSYSGTVKLDGTSSSTAGIAIAGDCTTANEKIAILDPVYREIQKPVVTAADGFTLTETITGRLGVTYLYDTVAKAYRGYYVYLKNNSGIVMPIGANVIAEFASGGYDNVVLTCGTTTFAQNKTITITAPSLTGASEYVTAADISAVTLNDISTGNAVVKGTVADGTASLSLDSAEVTPGQYELVVTGTVTAYGVTSAWSASVQIMVTFAEVTE